MSTWSGQRSELGAPIAHGYLTLSLLPMLAAQIMRVENVAARHQFRLQQGALHQHGAGRLKGSFAPETAQGGRTRRRQQMIMENTIEIEGKDRPACVAEAISIIYGG